MTDAKPAQPAVWVQELDAEIRALVKAAQAMDVAMQAFCKHPGPVEDGSLFAAHRGLQAAIKPFTREA